MRNDMKAFVLSNIYDESTAVIDDGDGAWWYYFRYREFKKKNIVSFIMLCSVTHM